MDETMIHIGAQAGRSNKCGVLIGTMLTAMCGAAQPPLPFPSGDVHWTVNSIQMGASYPSTTYATMGDSTFNGFTYRKIGRVENMGSPWQPEDLIYSGSLRDDSGRWLFVPSWSAEEYPLFDFTGEVGDTVSIHNPGATVDPMDYVVQAIGTVATLAGERRMWTIQPPEYPGFDEYFIEGIGSTYGLFGHGIFLFDVGLQLVCMEQNGELIYRIPEAESCIYLSTSTPDLENDLQIAISPNPANEEIRLGLPQTDHTTATISLHDALGRSVAIGVERSGQNMMLDVSRLPTGLYTVTLSAPGMPVTSARVMVQR